LATDARSAPRTVVVTGAAGHLGQAVAQLFVERGDNVALVARRKSLERAFGGETSHIMFAAADLLDRAQVDAAVPAILARFGGIDVLCNIAGGFRMGTPVHATSDADWTAMFDLNLRTTLNAIRAVVPAMLERGGGKVVNVAAASALKAAAAMGPYAAAKSAVIRVTEAMAAELRERNINVNCVLPTMIDTPDNRSALPGADPSRWVAPRDLARVVAFLASDEARAVHGAAIPVSGLS
jgi:NAD(P)-dependent dehydrogenase (short-subunit alcohol dehydrogenase family)